MSELTKRSSASGRIIENAPLMVAVLLTLDSLHFIFARLLKPYVPSGTAALYVLGVATIEVGVYLAMKRQLRWRLLWEHFGFFTAIGFLVAAATSLSYLAVSYLDPGTAALLAQTSTVLSLGVGLLWLKESLSRWQAVGALVTIAGSFVIGFQPSDVLRIGSLIVLGGVVMYVLHAAIVKKYGGKMEFGNFFFYRVASTMLFLVLFALMRGQLVWVIDGRAWLFFVLAGTVDVVISRVLYYLTLRRLQMSIHALLLTLSPVITILWSLALFGERPSTQGLIGGTAVILGILILTSVNKKPHSHQ